jgi:hypothetical protein
MCMNPWLLLHTGKVHSVLHHGIMQQSPSDVVILTTLSEVYAEVCKVTLKSSGDEALSDEFLLKSNGDEALNDVFSIKSNGDEAFNAKKKL